jgi:hypothetical protein
VRMLDASNVQEAMTTPIEFREKPGKPLDSATLELPGYSVARIDTHSVPNPIGSLLQGVSR